LDFETLAEKFNLIKNLPGQVYVLIGNYPEAKKIHKSIKDRKKIITPKFFWYAISLSYKIAIRLVKEGILESVQDLSNNVLYFYLNQENSRKYYDEIYGFQMGYNEELENENANYN
ncbi:MAG: hypothetical protein ACTSXP_07300, partial [Promethearchaeota archaeon]